MKISYKTAVALMSLTFYAILVVHDSVLYPFAPLQSVARVGVLRFFLIAAPIALGFLITKKRARRAVRTVASIFWLIFLPYTMYSLTEIRHVTEICRPETPLLFTEACLPHAWMLLPMFTYALAGVLAFVFTVSQVTAFLFKISWQKQIVILALCGYTAFATVFGLTARMNIWTALTHPEVAAEYLAAVIMAPFFWVNTAAFAGFFALIYFAVNRFIKRSNMLLLSADKQ